MSKTPTQPKRVKRMVPNQSVTVNVEEVALQIVTRIYMDTAGFKTEKYIDSAFDAAEKFIEVAEARKQKQNSFNPVLLLKGTRDGKNSTLCQ